jgi:hypothetical protein
MVELKLRGYLPAMVVAPRSALVHFARRCLGLPHHQPVLEYPASDEIRMKPAEWALLVIASAGGRPLQPVQLQKSLFLLSRNLPVELTAGGFYQFEAYDYGPFSRMIYEDAEALEGAKFVRIQRPPEARFNLYSATTAGKDVADRLGALLPPRATAYVRDIVSFTQSLPFNELVSTIYLLYPDTKINSVFQG